MSTDTQKLMFRGYIFATAFALFSLVTAGFSLSILFGSTKLTPVFYLFPVITIGSLIGCGYIWYLVVTLPGENYDTVLND